MTNCNTQANIEKKVQENKTLGRYATKLPKFLAGVFSNPRLTCASTTLLCNILAIGKKDGTYSIQKTTNPHWTKKTVVPFLANLETLENQPIFSSIEYEGDRKISFSLSDTIHNEVQRSIQKNDYISVNLDELAKLRGKYTKQIYLLLCQWRRKKALCLGFNQVNKLFSLPKYYRTRFSSSLLEPALAQINEKTNLQTQIIQTTKKGWLVVFYRKTKGLAKVNPKNIRLIKDKDYLERKRRRFWEILNKKTPQKHDSYQYLKKESKKRELLETEDYLRKLGKLKNYSQKRGKRKFAPQMQTNPTLSRMTKQGGGHLIIKQ